MAAPMTTSIEAQLREAENLIAYFRARTCALAQHIIDRDALHAERAREAETRDTDLNAQIAGLQEDLRIARAERPTNAETTHGE